MATSYENPRKNTAARVLFASLVGTSVEFFDFYIYATAAVLVFPKLFFPAHDATAATLASFATFGIAFIARPVGSALFGHIGDRTGRKATLVLALSTMGLATMLIGVLPTYQNAGLVSSFLLALCRFGQGIGLGGEWGGAVLLATENATPGKRALYGMFPQLGAPIGFVLSSGVFLGLSHWLTNEQFLRFGWRIPFLASGLLVGLGLYVRLSLTETPVFQETLQKREAVKLPLLTTLSTYSKQVAIGTAASLATFVLFYLMVVFSLGWATTALGYSKNTFIGMQLVGILFFALTIPISAALAKLGRKPVMLLVTAAIAVYGFFFPSMFQAGPHGALAMLIVGLSLMGMTYGPLGTLLAELFPTEVRYTGASLAFSLAGILGASVAPYAALWLAHRYGLAYVGYYLASMAAITFVGLLAMPETRNKDLTAI